jgi:hypothetical protein
MSESWSLRVFEGEQLVYSIVLQGIVELGRQSRPEEQPYSLTKSDQHQRIIIAAKDERSVSRQHVLIEPLPEGLFRIKNLSTHQPLGLPHGTGLAPGETLIVAGGTLLLGPRSIRLSQEAAPTLADPEDTTLPNE